MRHSPDVGLVAVVLASEVPGGALVGDAHHGDLLAVAGQVAGCGADTALLGILNGCICEWRGRKEGTLCNSITQ